MASSSDNSSDGSDSSSEDEKILQQGSRIIVPTAFDSYFTHNAAKSQTSANVFSSLVPPLSHEEYTEAFKSFPAPIKSKLLTDEGFRDSVFDRMMLELQAGFNLLCYGYGSKRELLNQFSRERCSKLGHVIQCNAYNPQFSLKDFLNSIEGLPGLVDMEATTTSVEAQTRRIQDFFSPPRRRNLYIILHNIDSPSLRTSKAKSCLSILALNPLIHLVASVDHINAPLLWSSSDAFSRKEDSGDISNSNSDRRGFAWLWHDLTTLTPYDAELAHADRSSIAGARKNQGKNASNSSSVVMSETAALHILASVTTKAKKLFVLMATSQLASEEAAEAEAKGTSDQQQHAISYDLLFNAARTDFIATSDTALRSLLGEFRDHELVVGADSLWIPMRKERLANVLKKMEASS